MGVISRLREKMRFVLYALLAAFLALIVFEWGMNFSGFSGGGALAGKVNGTPVEYRQYEQVYDRLVDNFRSQAPQEELTDVVERELRQRAWDIIVNQIILEEQFEKYNIHVADKDILAVVEGDNPPMVILQNFINPETGSVDREKLDEARRAPENRDVWVRIEDIIRRELMVEKLQQIIQSMAKVSDSELDALAEREFSAFSASFFVVPYSVAGDDSLFTVADEEVEAYYDENREFFRQEPTRSLDYVVFSAVPTGRDSLKIKTELESLAEDFAGTADDSAFVSLQSDRSGTFGKLYTRADFSVQAGDEVFGDASLKAGAVIGPVADRNTYRLVKVKEVSEEGVVARASHILIPFTQGDASGRQAARGLADRIIQEIRSGKNFADLARKYSKDPGTAANGGDLGWFGKNTMVPEFDQAVFNAAKGALVGPVETQFGLHIIKVTGKDSKAIACSEIVRDIRPSGATLENARRKAAEFQIEAEEKGFDKAYESFGKKKYTTGPFSKAGMIPEIGYNNLIVRFAFTSAEGSISDIIETGPGFLVMQVAGKNDSGYKALDAGLQDTIRAELIKRKKGEALDARLSALLKQKNGDLEAVAAALGGVQVVNADNIRFKEQTVPVYGNDIRLIEAITGMDPGTVSKPVPVRDGTALIALHSRTYPDNPDLESEKARLRPMLERVKKERFLQDYFDAERRAATIEDLREF